MTDQATNVAPAALPAPSVTTIPAATTPPAKSVDSMGVADFMSMNDNDLDKLIAQASTPASVLPVTAPAAAPATVTPTPPAATAQPQPSPAAALPAAVNVPPAPPADPLKALEAEIAATLAPSTTTPAAAPAALSSAPAAAPAAAPAEQMVQDPETGKVVPLSALLHQRKENQELKERLAKLEGKIEVLQPASPQPAAPTRTVDDELTELHDYETRLERNLRDQTKALAKQYDEGHITSLVQFEEKKAELTDKTAEIRRRISDRVRILDTEKAKPSPQAMEKMTLADPFLTSATTALVAANPWVDNLPEATFNVLRDHATSEMEQMKLPVDFSPASVWNLRNAIVEMGKRFGFDRAFAQPITPTAAAPAAGGQPAAPAAPAVDSLLITPEQRAAKLVLANLHPANPSVAGTTPAGSEVSPLPGAQLDGMTPQQLATMLPAKTLEKMAYGDFAVA